MAIQRPTGPCGTFFMGILSLRQQNGVMFYQLLQLNRDATGIAGDGGINFI
ncbi:hypothetical protein ACTJIJ_25475 [Niabella sp. 22666]|uniref:hypothetical protein n=1 Tax=Niabella sp. 22666 TaxID=3453954 RepID=UPI003F83D129